MSQTDQGVPTPDNTVGAPVAPILTPQPVLKTSVFAEVPAGEIRTPQGARILRSTKPEGPDTLGALYDHLKAAQVAYLKAGRERAKDPQTKADPLLPVVESMGITLDKEPNRRIRLGMAVNTYVMIKEEAAGLVARYYAQIPASFNNAAAKLLSEFGHPIRQSTDSFVRPSGI